MSQWVTGDGSGTHGLLALFWQFSGYITCSSRFSDKLRALHIYFLFKACMISIIILTISGRLPRFRWDVIWLPFGPLGGAAICLYVDHLLAESSGEVKKLRGYMYAFKAN